MCVSCRDFKVSSCFVNLASASTCTCEPGHMTEIGLQVIVNNDLPQVWEHGLVASEQEPLRAVPVIRIHFYLGSPSHVEGGPQCWPSPFLTWPLVGLGVTKGAVPVIGSVSRSCRPLWLGPPAIRAVPVSRFGGTPG